MEMPKCHETRSGLAEPPIPAGKQATPQLSPIGRAGRLLLRSSVARGASACLQMAQRCDLTPSEVGRGRGRRTAKERPYLVTWGGYGWRSEPRLPDANKKRGGPCILRLAGLRLIMQSEVRQGPRGRTGLKTGSRSFRSAIRAIWGPPPRARGRACMERRRSATARRTAQPGAAQGARQGARGEARC